MPRNWMVGEAGEPFASPHNSLPEKCGDQPALTGNENLQRAPHPGAPTTLSDRYGAGVERVRPRHTPGQLDAVVLSVLQQRNRLPTYVIANYIGHSPGWDRPDTARVLRSCRRLQARGLIDEAASEYAVMKVWQRIPTPGGSDE